MALRANKLWLYLYKLSLFMAAVTFLSIFKIFIIGKQSHRNRSEFSLMKLSEQNSILGDYSTSESANFSDIIIGGLKLKKNKCMSDILETLPDYALEFCKNHTENCSGLSCMNIITGSDLDKYKKIIELLPEEASVLPDRVYLNLTINCDIYKKQAGFKLIALNKKSKTFPIAFNILIHKSASQFELLLRALYRPQNVFCVHVDNKSSPDFQKAVEGITKCFDNVYLASKRESVTWAGFSRLQADITCMKDQLSRNISWKYLINTAGQAFPLTTIEEMVQILEIYNGSNDIEGIYGGRVIKSRFENEFVEEHNHLTKTGRKNPKPPHDIDIVRGSAYGIFSRKFVEFIINDKKAVDFREWSRKTWSPDELYWATLHHTHNNPHLRTPGGFSGYPSKKEWLAVYANWGELPCKGKFKRGVCINGVGDISALVGRKELFVNKFYQNYQPLALSCLSSWIDFKAGCKVPFNESFYRNLKFINKPR